MAERLRRTQATAWTLCAVALLTSCSNEGPPPPQLPTSISATASPAADATVPPTASPIPAGAHGPARNVVRPVMRPNGGDESKEGLENFTRYFFDLLSYGFETGDVDDWLKLTDPSCKFCSNLAGGIRAGYEGGKWLGGARVFTESVDAMTKDGVLTRNVTLLVRQEEIRFFSPDGTETRAPKAQIEQPTVVFLSYREGAWFVDDMGRLVE
ncbi:DUF6318 family protein [Arthrobacter sp. UNC362MFTsu5.1]|uniref:DUF6318 family protein n=1 Tax=Arthrobacter sp. UNC362MFTsu5.1 TaxID=1449044 RepID=UPI0012DC955F|nr:DUF6318 family protein [Arthrobacter sp. UNC362MFTsu5.1]